MVSFSSVLLQLHFCFVFKNGFSLKENFGSSLGLPLQARFRRRQDVFLCTSQFFWKRGYLHPSSVDCYVEVWFLLRNSAELNLLKLTTWYGLQLTSRPWFISSWFERNTTHERVFLGEWGYHLTCTENVYRDYSYALKSFKVNNSHEIMTAFIDHSLHLLRS